MRYMRKKCLDIVMMNDIVNLFWGECNVLRLTATCYNVANHDSHLGCRRGVNF